MLEYLILNGRLEAAYQYHQVCPRNFKEQLITLFNRGRRKDFMRLFVLLKTEEKLEFYIRVYFLIYNIHPSIKPKGSIPEQEVAAFRQFLQSKGADLAKTNEFLQFYALSYVKKPLEHPSYKNLFTKEWINSLTQKLALFLQSEEKRMKECILHYEQAQNPKSQQFRSSEVIFSNNLKDLQAKNMSLFEEVQAFKQKYHQLQQNNQALIQSFNSHLMQSQNKWFQITRELTNNSKVLVDLIASSSSNAVHDRRYQRIKKRTEKFQKIVKKELDQLLNQSQDISVFDKPSINEISYSASITPNVSQRNLTTFLAFDEFIPINFSALMRDFKKMGDSQKISVLQGLSWRMVKSKNKSVRRQTIVALVVSDFLGLENGDIQILMFNQTLTFHILELLSFISEDSYGRKVFFRNGGLYKQVVQLIPQVLQNSNYLCLDLILQILLNIWHDKDIYRELINLKIIDICINSLLQNTQISTNHSLLESVVTILLNATATEHGLIAFQSQINVFYQLSQAFREANDSNRNLIGSTIYALLGRKNLWKLAHQANLPNFIEDMLQLDERSNKQQLKLIKSKFHSFQIGKIVGGEELELEQSTDSNLEQQAFERNADQLNDAQEYIKGHQILTAKYGLSKKQAQKQLDQISKVINKSQDILPKPVQPVFTKNGSKQAVIDSNKGKQKIVHLPQIKRKKDSMQIFNPKLKNKDQDSKEYYTYKSPNFKHNQQNAVSAQANRSQSIQESHKAKVHSFEYNSFQVKRQNRVFTKPHEHSNEIYKKEQDHQQERRYNEKPEYRIKKSTSVQKGNPNPNQKQPVANQYNKNSANVSEYKSIQAIKSPPQKKSREQVLKQLNQQLKQKKTQDKDRKLSNKHIPAIDQGKIQRENTYLKKNNFVAAEQEVKAFEPKPKLRRTPPSDEK